MKSEAPGSGENPGNSFRRFEDWLLGIRPGFGVGGEALRCFMEVESRSPFSWIIPGLGVLIVLGLYLLLCVWSVTGFTGLYVSGALFRIFVFDYTIFFFGLVSGFSMARRWRSNSAQVEELSLAPLKPSVMGGIFASGSIRAWWRYLVLFAAIETIVCIPHVMELDNAMRLFDGGGFLFALHPATWITGLAILLCPWVLAWFHFESVRLAHWMFAAHALPRVPLARAGAVNFGTMTGLVIGLSGLGSAVTAMAVALIAIVTTFLMLATGNSPLGESFYFGYTVWMLASVAGAIAVLWLKRKITVQYETAFVKSWLLYQWWGAGESTQPDVYSEQMRRALPFWILYFRVQEEADSNLPASRRIHTRNYERIMGGQLKGSPELPPSQPGATPDPLASPDQHPTITSDKS